MIFGHSNRTYTHAQEPMASLFLHVPFALSAPALVLAMRALERLGSFGLDFALSMRAHSANEIVLALARQETQPAWFETDESKKGRREEKRRGKIKSFINLNLSENTGKRLYHRENAFSNRRSTATCVDTRGGALAAQTDMPTNQARIHLRVYMHIDSRSSACVSFRRCSSSCSQHRMHVAACVCTWVTQRLTFLTTPCLCTSPRSRTHAMHTHRRPHMRVHTLSLLHVHTHTHL